MAIHPIIAERKLEALRHALGDTILAALVEPAVVEILANPDGRLILDRSGEGRRDSGATLSARRRAGHSFDRRLCRRDRYAR